MQLMQRLAFLVCALVGIVVLSSPAQAAEDVAVGVGFVFGPYNLPPAEQETILGQMERAGVRMVRCSMSYDDEGVDFVQRVYAHGIKIIWMVGSTPAAGTPWPTPRKVQRTVARISPVRNRSGPISGEF